MAPSSKMSTISNANVAAVTAQYTQEYRTPYGPTIPCLSTRLRMKATIPTPAVRVNDARWPAAPSPDRSAGDEAVSSRHCTPRWRAAVHLPADDEGLDVVPAVAVGDIRDALLEFCEKVGEETVGAVLALAREGAEEERAAPCGHAPHVVPREDDGIVVPVGIVQTEELGALELEAGDASVAFLEGVSDLVERAHPHRNDYGAYSRRAYASCAAPVGEQPVHVPDELHVESPPLRARSGRRRERGDEPATPCELRGAHLEQPLPLARRGHPPGSPLCPVDVIRVAREYRPGRGQTGRVGDPVHRGPADRNVHAAGRQAGRPVEGNPRHADHHGWGRVALNRSAAGRAVGLRRGVVDPRAGIGDPRTGVPRRGDDYDLRPVRSSTEGMRQVVGGDPPDVRRQIYERVDQRPAGALLRELADEAVGVDPVGGAEIDHAERRLVSKQPRGAQRGRVGRLEGGALRERVPRVVVCHAREVGAI